MLCSRCSAWDCICWRACLSLSRSRSRSTLEKKKIKYSKQTQHNWSNTGNKGSFHFCRNEKKFQTEEVCENDIFSVRGPCTFRCLQPFQRSEDTDAERSRMHSGYNIPRENLAGTRIRTRTTSFVRGNSSDHCTLHHRRPQGHLYRCVLKYAPFRQLTYLCTWMKSKNQGVFNEQMSPTEIDSVR